LILPDVNVLIYAFRADSVDHPRYKNWLSELVNGAAAYGIASEVLASLVRICTHPRIFREPSSIDDALLFCNVVLEAPNATLLSPQERHWSIFHDLCMRAKATGNLVPDAWLAALAIEAGCEWITTDGDFARFPGLRWRRPF
jgi:toxin-antitoxin system PIN domain toxin